MYLFFDTETTGLPKRWNAPVTDLENWPRLVQLAWIMYDDRGNMLESRDVIVKPEGFTIPPEASRVHGITTLVAREKGWSNLPERSMKRQLWLGIISASTNVLSGLNSSVCE